MNFGDAVRSCLQNYATFSGRARRSEFWFFMLFNLLVQVVAGVVDSMILGVGAIGAIATLGLFLPNLAVAVRRLHDTGRSGWLILVGLIPLIGWILLLVWYCSQGDSGPNRFGDDPRGTAGGWVQPPAAPPGGPARPWQAGPR
jgi:uncharacterized membrane protein YhaH (DUF805 family)